MALSSSQGFLVVLKCSQGFLVVLSDSQLISVVIKGFKGFFEVRVRVSVPFENWSVLFLDWSVPRVLSCSQWLSAVLKGSQWFSVVLKGSL